MSIRRRPKQDSWIRFTPTLREGIVMVPVTLGTCLLLWWVGVGDLDPLPRWTVVLVAAVVVGALVGIIQRRFMRRATSG